MKKLILQDNTGYPVAKLKRHTDRRLSIYEIISNPKHDSLPTVLEFGFNKIIETQEGLDFITYRVERDTVVGYDIDFFEKISDSIYRQLHTKYESIAKINIDSSKERT